MHRVNETHRLYDALQYPIIYWQGQDGYDITLKMVDPITSRYNIHRLIIAIIAIIGIH